MKEILWFNEKEQLLWYILGMVKQGLTKEQVSHMAKLSALPLTTEEVCKFSKQLSEVVSFVEKIAEVKGKEKAERVKGEDLKDNTALKEDEINSVDCLSQEAALSQTETVHNGMFVVPEILEE